MKKLIAVILAVVMLLTFGTGTALAAQPVASGGARVVNGDILVDFSFTVRVTGGISAEGTLNYIVHAPDYTRQLKCDVQYASVDGNRVKFAAIITRDSYPEGGGGTQVGRWVVVEAFDVSNPGVDNDLIWRQFYSDQSEALTLISDPSIHIPKLQITDGNIQVR